MILYCIKRDDNRYFKGHHYYNWATTVKGASLYTESEKRSRIKYATGIDIEKDLKDKDGFYTNGKNKYKVVKVKLEEV